MNRLLVLVLISMLSSTVFGDVYIPKTLKLITMQSVEIYHVSTDCWLHEYEGQDPYKSWSVYLGKTTDLSIRDTSDYCSNYTDDVTTSCEEDMVAYLDVISGTDMCELRAHSHSPGSAGGEALCKGTRSSVVNMIYELCSIMLNAE